MSTPASQRPHSDTAEACPLCDATKGASLRHKGIDANKVIMVTDKFILIPALGPLVPGHVLAVSRTHSVGLAYLSKEARVEYRRLAIHLRQFCSRKGDNLLEAEHGGSVNRGPCIQHTHVHLFPRLGEYLEVLCDHLPPIGLSSLSTAMRPYIWMHNGVAQRLYNASSATGQEIRRSLGEKLRIDDWDWAINPKWEMIRSTIGYWKNGEMND